MVGDADGVMATPKKRAVDVAEIAEAIEGSEHQLHDLVRGGMPLDEALPALNGHLLQTRIWSEGACERPMDIP